MKAKFKTMKKKQQKPLKPKMGLPKKKISDDRATIQKDAYGGVPDIDLKKNLGCG